MKKSPFLSNFDKKGLLANQHILMDFPLKCELQSSKDSATDRLQINFTSNFSVQHLDIYPQTSVPQIGFQISESPFLSGFIIQ